MSLVDDLIYYMNKEASREGMEKLKLYVDTMEYIYRYRCTNVTDETDMYTLNLYLKVVQHFLRDRYAISLIELSNVVSITNISNLIRTSMKNNKKSLKRTKKEDRKKILLDFITNNEEYMKTITTFDVTRFTSNNNNNNNNQMTDKDLEGIEIDTYTHI